MHSSSFFRGFLVFRTSVSSRLDVTCVDCVIIERVVLSRSLHYFSSSRSLWNSSLCVLLLSFLRTTQQLQLQAKWKIILLDQTSISKLFSEAEWPPISLFHHRRYWSKYYSRRPFSEWNELNCRSWGASYDHLRSGEVPVIAAYEANYSVYSVLLLWVIQRAAY